MALRSPRKFARSRRGAAYTPSATAPGGVALSGKEAQNLKAGTEGDTLRSVVCEVCGLPLADAADPAGACRCERVPEARPPDELWFAAQWRQVGSGKALRLPAPDLQARRPAAPAPVTRRRSFLGGLAVLAAIVIAAVTWSVAGSSTPTAGEPITTDLTAFALSDSPGLRGLPPVAGRLLLP
ncbi:MAG: hypothetical protein NVSMB51_18180 [Solirubrobacteraceae bacterium]